MTLRSTLLALLLSALAGCGGDRPADRRERVEHRLGDVATYTPPPGFARTDVPTGGGPSFETSFDPFKTDAEGSVRFRVGPTPLPVADGVPSAAKLVERLRGTPEAAGTVAPTVLAGHEAVVVERTWERPSSDGRESVHEKVWWVPLGLDRVLTIHVEVRTPEMREGIDASLGSLRLLFDPPSAPGTAEAAVAWYASDDERQRAVAEELLAAWGPAGLEAAARALRAGTLDPERHDAGRLLARTAGSQADLLGGLIEDGNPAVRRCAVRALAIAGGDHAARMLLARLQSAPAEERSEILEGLGRTRSEQALEPLLQALSAAEAPLRIAAAGALGELADPRAIDPLLEAARRGDPPLQATAFRALGALGARQALDAMRTAIESGAPGTRAAAAEGLGSLRDAQAVELLCEAANGPDAGVREVAREGLAAARYREAVPGLARCLQIDDVGVREAVLEALATPDADAAADAAAALGKALDHPDPTLRLSAVRALYRIDDDAAIGPLVAALCRSDDSVAEVARASLGNRAERATGSLLPLLQSADPRIRRRAASALERQRDPRVVEVLIRALGDPEPDVRRAAAHALASIGDARAAQAITGLLSDPRLAPAATEALVRLGPSAAPALGEVMRHGGEAARLEAVRTLAAIAGSSAQDLSQLDEPLRLALADSDPRIRAAAVEAVGLMRDPASETSLVALLRDPDGVVRQHAARALGRLRSTAAAGPLVELLTDPDLYVRVPVARALGQIKAPQALDPLIAELNAELSDLRIAAAEALAKLQDPRAVDPLLAALADPNEGVRAVAAQALGRLGDPRARGPLVRVLEGDKGARVRSAAARALWPVADAEVVAVLERARSDPQAEVSRAARWSLAQLTGEPVGPPARS
jgi:HEAT repeat protein